MSICIKKEDTKSHHFWVSARKSTGLTRIFCFGKRKVEEKKGKKIEESRLRYVMDKKEGGTGIGAAFGL